MRYREIQEGVHDPYIFKAIFLSGGPGSGKSYVSKALGLMSLGLKVINSDDALEHLMKKSGLDLNMPDDQEDQRNQVRSTAKNITNMKKTGFLRGRLGVIIDGTARDPEKTARVKTEFEKLGYHTMMVFVDTDLKTALARNQARERTVPEKIVVASHKEVQQAKLALNNLFAANWAEVQNHSNGNLELRTAQQKIRKFLNLPLSNTAQQWIQDQKSPASQNSTVTQESQVSEKKRLAEQVTDQDIKSLETYLDRLYGKLGIDVNFTRHFVDRVNDSRNGKPINISELVRLFKQTHRQHGKSIKQMGPDAQAVLKDMRTDVNLPFVLNWDPENSELDLVAKTVMRKKKFMTSNPVLSV